MTSLTPETAQFAIVSFEGPDEYSRSGGLAVRVRGLSETLAGLGFATHLFFMGDASLPSVEQNGNLTLHRWGQWISSYHPGGVYDGEWDKLNDMATSLPWPLIDGLIRPAAETGKVTVLMAEDWQTVNTIQHVAYLLAQQGLSRYVIPVWTANNLFGFYTISWPVLSQAATVMTVSKYMKHEMWDYGVNPLVTPNGLEPSALVEVPEAHAVSLREAFGRDVALFKIGRYTPDKRWTTALDAVAVLKYLGSSARILIRGDKSPYGYEVLAVARSRGLIVDDLTDRYRNADELAGAIRARPEVDVLNLTSFLPDDLLPVIYASVDGVLANSSHEPFGLVGLEVMGAGGLAFVGATGEDYAEPHRNAVVLDTDDPREIAVQLRQLTLAQITMMKGNGKETAKAYVWAEVLQDLFAKLEYVALTRGVEIGR
jgi:glycosyltransferase involved in cell wall biosynthesis